MTPARTARARAPQGDATVLDRLREETRAAHDAIERVFDWEGRLATREGYRALLARLYGFHAAWEPSAAALLDDPALFEPRRKAHLLARDLIHLGLVPEELARLSRPGGDAAPRTRAEALGGLYVLEGSTLGGQVIARHLARTLGVGPDAGGAYYAAYGEAVGPMWRAVRARLLAEASDPAAADAVVAAAGRTFEAMRAWLAA